MVRALMCFYVILQFITVKSIAQTELLSEIDMLHIRRLATLDLTQPRDSLSSQMLFLASHAFDNDSGYPIIHRKGIHFVLHRIGMAHQYNSHVGQSINDGTFLPNVGLQSRTNLNLSFRWKRLSLKLAPELTYAANKTPASFDLDPTDANYFARYYLYIVNKIDMYPRFGVTPQIKFHLGQSSLKYDFKKFEVGVATENLWWGPSTRNALVMSHNARGIPHVSMNTFKPLHTALGSFEAQFIFGILSNVELDFPDNPRMRGIWEGGIAQKKKLVRTIYGYTMNWQPKWVKNFFLGFALANQRYFNYGNASKNSSSLFLKNNKMKLGSFFLRYALPEDQTELYIEVGRADRLATPFNIFKDRIPLGYTAGIRKLVNLSSGKHKLFFGLEATRLQLPDPRLIFREANVWGPPKTNSWYTSDSIRQGYTQYGETIGAYIGPGSNSQMLQIGWLQGYRKILLIGERVQHNNDFYYYNYFNGNTSSAIAVNNKYWVDLSAGIQVQWPISNFLLCGMYKYTSLLNYRWIKLDGGFSGRSVLSDRQNENATLSVYWFFNKSFNVNTHAHSIKIKK